MLSVCVNAKTVSLLMKYCICNKKSSNIWYRGRKHQPQNIAGHKENRINRIIQLLVWNVSSDALNMESINKAFFLSKNDDGTL